MPLIIYYLISLRIIHGWEKGKIKGEIILAFWDSNCKEHTLKIIPQIW